MSFLFFEKQVASSPFTGRSKPKQEVSRVQPSRQLSKRGKEKQEKNAVDEFVELSPRERDVAPSKKKSSRQPDVDEFVELSPRERDVAPSKKKLSRQPEKKQRPSSKVEKDVRDAFTDDVSSEEDAAQKRKKPVKQKGNKHQRQLSARTQRNIAAEEMPPATSTSDRIEKDLRWKKSSKQQAGKMMHSSSKAQRDVYDVVSEESFDEGQAFQQSKVTKVREERRRSLATKSRRSMIGEIMNTTVMDARPAKVIATGQEIKAESRKRKHVESTALAPAVATTSHQSHIAMSSSIDAHESDSGGEAIEWSVDDTASLQRSVFACQACPALSRLISPMMSGLLVGFATFWLVRALYMKTLTSIVVKTKHDRDFIVFKW